MIIQNIMKTFHRAMKIRKYLRLSKNSRMLSPGKSESVFVNTTNISAFTPAGTSVVSAHPYPHSSGSSFSSGSPLLPYPHSTQTVAGTDQSWQSTKPPASDWLRERNMIQVCPVRVSPRTCATTTVFCQDGLAGLGRCKKSSFNKAGVGKL